MGSEYVVGKKDGRAVSRYVREDGEKIKAGMRQSKR
jgi:hypothetical protein